MHGFIGKKKKKTFHNRKNAAFCTNVPMETEIRRLILLGSKKEITSNTFLISTFIQNHLDFFFKLLSEPSLESGGSQWEEYMSWRSE